MTPNQITALRVAMGFAAVALFGRGLWCDVGALALTIGAISLDAVDGYLARRRQLATPLGAQLDIIGDRVVENLFFTFFAVTGLVSLWVPIFFFVRGTLTDFIRGLAARAGRSGFGKNSMLETWWGRSLVASRASRAAYGVMKCLCFCYLGAELTLLRLPPGTLTAVQAAWLNFAAEALVGATVAFCFVRAVPVAWEGRKYFLTAAPVTAKAAGGAR
ncbi:MAG TPA: CDP-alcohol phosphatidyltransferase family protein [Candidatus Acidoferrales bacterium]|nr:CDP-alcohol phosphatidyltransferase family protein [Candidatus Acidoferrales bacterium]